VLPFQQKETPLTVIRNPASPGAPAQVVAETPLRAPLLGNITWANHAAHPAVVGPVGPASHVRPVSQALVDATGGKLDRK
jgi:hypothetical protein